MQGSKLILVSISMMLCFVLKAQESMTYREANDRSFILYEKAAWKELLQFGKTAIAAKQDFILLRLRMGYAAFMLSGYSEALQHYEAVLQKDTYNETARYYSWLSLQYLNRNELAGTHVRYFSRELLQKEKLKPVAFTGAGIESSFKNTGLSVRGSGWYNRIDLGLRLGWNLYMNQSVAMFNQTIGEPGLTAVINNRSININQKEYYNRLIFNAGRHWQVKGAYHYLYTPFNNFVYDNQAAMIALRYNGSYVNVQADAIVGNVTDTSQQQYNLHLEVYPRGNLSLYGISTATIRNRNGQTGFNFKQVAGCRLFKNTWLEANATLGPFSNLFENDALYLYNAIDRNLFKGGATLYMAIRPTLLLQAGYTFEQRERFKTNNTFYQHSITGGLSWKF